MRLTKTLFTLGSLLATATGVLHSQTLSFDFSANSVANYRQSPTQISYEGGSFGVNVRDGNFVFLGPCVFEEFFGPSLLCPPGATGFVNNGDINGDGILDSGVYLSITSVIDSTLIEPFTAPNARLVAAPPSLLPRPLGGFTDNSVTYFFNLRTNFVRQFAITDFNFARQYTAGERIRFDGETVPGTYLYNFTSRVSDTVPLPVALTLFPRLDGFREVNNQRLGFRFTGLTFDDGFAVLDPNAINTITWTGNDVSLIAPGLDSLFFSIKPLSDPTDPTSDPLFFDGGENFVVDPITGELVVNPTLPIFPNFITNGAGRVVLPSALSQSYTIPPQFLAPGRTGIIDLEFVLNRPTSAAIGDRSTTRFRLPVRVTDPLVIPPPAGIASADFNDPAADADSDGVSNFDEWVFNSDRGDPSSVPTAASLNFMPSSPTSESNEGFGTLSADEPSGYWEFRVEKKRNPVPKLTYEIQRSTDMVTWTTIEEGDPDWDLINDDVKSEIKVVSRDPDIEGGGFFRAKVTAEK